MVLLSKSRSENVTFHLNKVRSPGDLAKLTRSPLSPVLSVSKRPFSPSQVAFMTPLLLLPHPISQPICIPVVLLLVTRGWGQLWASPQAFITTPFSFLDPRLLKSSLFLLSREIHSTEPPSPCYC